MINVWANAVLGLILHQEPANAMSALEETVPLCKAVPGLLSEVHSRLYRSARDDLMALTTYCHGASLPDRVPLHLVLQITNGDIESAVREINHFLSHVDLPVDQEVSTLEELTALLSKLAEERRLAEDPVVAAVFREAVFLLSPRKDRLENMIEAFIHAQAYPRVKNYLPLGVRLGFLGKEDLMELRRSAESWRSDGAKDMPAIPSQKENKQSTISSI
jgi:hypothetical protein